MNVSEKTYLSKEKQKALTEELTKLKTIKRKEIAEQLEYAKSLGDLSENAEYHEARDNQASLEERILKIETVLKNAVIVTDRPRSKISVGSKVVIREEKTKKESSWEIVGSEESDLASGKISNESPLGGALIGGDAGDSISTQTPKGETRYTILKVE